MTLVLQGFSGCGIEVRRPTPSEAARCTDPCHYVVDKRSSGPSYNDRLQCQIDKQQAYRDKLRVMASTTTMTGNDASTTTTGGNTGSSPPLPCTVKVPEVLGIETEADSKRLVVSMVFENHTDCVSFLQKATVGDLEAFTSTILGVLEAHVRASPVARVDPEIVLSKLRSIQSVVRGNAAIAAYHKTSGDATDGRSGETTTEHVSGLTQQLHDWIASLAADEGALELPLGLCHGDFTLSNILVQHGQASTVDVVLIDFLDSFVETPLADLAKLSQDLLFGWTLRMLGGSNAVRDVPRIYIAYDYMQKAMLRRFGHHEWFQRFFHFFLVVNQLRVLQYAKTPGDIEYLLQTVDVSFRMWKCNNAQS